MDSILTSNWWVDGLFAPVRSDAFLPPEQRSFWFPFRSDARHAPFIAMPGMLLLV